MLVNAEVQLDLSVARRGKHSHGRALTRRQGEAAEILDPIFAARLRDVGLLAAFDLDVDFAGPHQAGGNAGHVDPFRVLARLGRDGVALDQMLPAFGMQYDLWKRDRAVSAEADRERRILA